MGPLIFYCAFCLGSAKHNSFPNVRVGSCLMYRNELETGLCEIMSQQSFIFSRTEILLYVRKAIFKISLKEEFNTD